MKKTPDEIKLGHKNVQTISDVAWECTIGAGEFDNDVPTTRSLATLAKRLGRSLQEGDLRVFREEWKRCIRAAWSI